MKLSELSSKDVINDEDGARLGKIVDLEIDVATGNVLNITISKGFRFVSLFNKEYVQIPWNKILKIGNDVIIVESNYSKKVETK